jgi:hypothetical protein
MYTRVLKTNKFVQIKNMFFNPKKQLQSKQHKNETQINKYEDEKLHSCFHT